MLAGWPAFAPPRLPKTAAVAAALTPLSLLQGCHLLSVLLEELGISAAALHSHKPQKARLAALQAAVLEQGQGFDAQVQSLLELGQQVRAAILGGRWLSTQQQQQQPPLWLL